MADMSLRAKLVERRTYLRPLDHAPDVFETKDMAVDRQINHQTYLWENARKEQFDYLLKQAKAIEDTFVTTVKNYSSVDDMMLPIREGRRLRERYEASWPLGDKERAELAELRSLIENRLVSLSGRVKWMADTDVIRERPSAAFNCSFTDVLIPADLVDVFWLLLQGCGTGFKPRVGLLTGFAKQMDVEIIPSTRTDRGGAEDTVEMFDGDTWTIKFGDSAKAWAKAIGKITSHKPMASKLMLDFSELRPAGQRLRGYGWISSGWEPFADGLTIICDVLNAKAGQTLDTIDIGDIVNALGTVLSSRRSAQIWLVEEDEPLLEDFIHVKDGIYNQGGKKHREQSNNSIAFKTRPAKALLGELLTNVLQGGEPGLYNLAAARRGTPWVQGTNPCGEIKLASKGFCNLAQVVWHRFNGNFDGLIRATEIVARANYRQTLVDMRDGVLQLQWHDTNKLLRLCGVSPTGVVGSDILGDAVKASLLKEVAINGANGMADEVGQARPALVTQVQPSGTGSKALGEVGDEVQEGAHISPTRFLLNNVNFSRHDPLVAQAKAAGYKVTDHPTQPASVIVAIPVAYPASDLYTPFKLSNGETIEVSTETAIDQLERYRFLMKYWVQHNCSITISFSHDEIGAITEWLWDNWDDYVGVSFLQRNDPTKTAADLGFAYLPQEAISKERYWDYVSSLDDIDFGVEAVQDGIDELTGCVTGACPIK